MKLKNKSWEEFCQQYIIDFNGARAARDAGFSPISAKASRVTAVRLMARPDVQKRVMELIENRSERTEITQDMVLRELAVLGFSDFTDFAEYIENERLTIKTLADIEEGPFGRKTRAIKSMKQVTSAGGGSISIKLHDKERALELLGKHVGLFEDAGDKIAKVLYELSEKFMPVIPKKNVEE